MIKHLKKVCFLLLISIIFINCASASEIDGLNETVISETSLPDTNIVIQNYTLDSDNIYEYFDEDGVLYENYSNSIFNLSDDIQNFGIIEIPVDNVTFIGNNYNLKNTVFYLSGNNITLCNFSMEIYHAFEDIEGSGIYIRGSDIIIDGIQMDYYVPPETRAYGIYADGARKSVVNNLKIINSNVYFVANNVYSKVSNHCVDLYYCNNTLLENNTFTGSFPLKDVNFGPVGADESSETVVLLGVIMSDYTRLNANTFITNIDDRFGDYPTLDAIFIYGSNFCNMTNNNLSMFDFITLSGVPNYLYGVDIYRLSNFSFTGNNIHIETTGGTFSHGTAYPIQMTGPYSNVTIAFNNLYSKSNGPNLGIYSMNYYGQTSLYIYNNTINVTGLAGEHEWALVAGIETQDDYAYIENNIIEVHSVREVGENDNLYGISYRQRTDGNHTQIVKNNIVFSDGLYSVYMLSTLNSVITDNILVSTRDDINYGYGGYKAGSGSHIGDTIYNNRIINYYDYFGRLYNSATGERTSMYRYQENVNNRTNEFDGTGMTGRSDNPTFTDNPTQSASSNIKYRNIPGGGSSSSGSGSGSGDGGNGNSGSTGGSDSGSQSGNGGYYSNSSSAPRVDEGGSSESSGLSWMDAVLNYLNSNTNSGSEEVQSYNGNVESNNTESTPDIAGSDAPASSSTGSEASGGAGASGAESQPKAYEISEKTDKSISPNNSYLSFALIIITMILLIIGYRRKDSSDEF